MPDQEVNPFAQFVQPTAEANPFDQFAQPSVPEDIKKAALPSLARGTEALVNTPATVVDLLGKGIAAGANKVSPAPEIANSNQPITEALGVNSSGPKDTRSVSDYVEGKDPSGINPLTDWLGGLYRAKTPEGKIASSAIEMVPTAVFGAGGWIPRLARALSAGAGSEIAGQATEGTSYEPWSRVGGAVLGGGFPSVARRVVTPFPAEAGHQAVIDAVRGKAPAFPMTAGQSTGSPRLQQFEANMAAEKTAPKSFNSIPEEQGKAFTRGTMQEMGVDGLATPQNYSQGAKNLGDTFKRYFEGPNAYEVQQKPFSDLQKAVASEKRNFFKAGGQSPLLDTIQSELKLGPSGSTAQTPLSMTGPRYQYMRERIQSALDDEATSGAEKTALGNIRKALDESMYKSMPKADADNLKTLYNQYTNSKVIGASKPSPEGILTPENVRGAVSKKMGPEAVVRGQSMVPWANNAERAMAPLPKASNEPGTAAKLVGSLGGLVGSAAAGKGYDPSIVAGILGREIIPDIVKALRSGVAPFALSKPGQAYLGNQLMMPGVNGTTDAGAFIRALEARQNAVPATQGQ